MCLCISFQQNMVKCISYSYRGVIPVVHHTGMSYLFYYTEQHTKHKRGKIDKHQRFWINTLLLKIYKLQ